MHHSTSDVPPLCLEGAQIIVGDGSTVIDRGAILVIGDTIAEVTAGDEVPSHSGADRVDMSGKTIMPAIVSAHGHLGYIKGAYTAKENFSYGHVLHHLQQLSYYGVGVILSLGTDRQDVELTLREEQRAGRLDPRLPLLLTAGVGITAPTPGEGNGGPFFASDVVREAATPEDGERIVAELAAKGPDAIKLWVDDRDGTKEKLSPETCEAIIAAAHAHGLKAVAHVYHLDDAKAVVKAGVDAIAHMAREPGTDDELIDLLVAQQTFAFTSIAVQRAIAFGYDWLDDPALAETTSTSALLDMRRQLESLSGGSAPAGVRSVFALEKFRLLESGLRKYKDGGVQVVMSADTGTLTQVPGFSEHREMQVMWESGMGPLEVIRSATSTPATMLGLSDRGTIAPGMRADLLVLDEDPLVEMSNTRKISDVFIGGLAVDRAALRQSLVVD